MRIAGAVTKGLTIATIALAGMLAVPLAGASSVSAQTVATPKGAKAGGASQNDESAGAPKADAASAQRGVEAGIKSFQEGKLEAATQQLSAALSTGKLPPPQVARALYYRGLAYRGQSKPAQAIADFTSALWLKNGLDATQRADALQNRGAAYREAGLSDQADGDEKKAASAAGQTSASRPSGAQTASASSPSSTQTASSSSGGFGSFFGNIFGGSSSVSASNQSADQPQEKVLSSPPRVATAWSTATEVKAEKTVATVPAAVVTGSPPPAAPPTPRARSSAAAGGIHLQVATVRSQSEARSIAARLKQMGVSDTAGVETEIDETTVGNMGTLYRVRIGPFANNDDPRTLCVKLRGSGLDCLITPQ